MTRLRSACLFLSLLFVACAHQEASTRPSSTESPAQSEIATLEKRIAEHKRSLPGSSGSSDSPIPMSSGDSASSGGRCDGVCQAAEEICTCHRRICKLAIDIGDEKSADSCRHAQRECEEAGKLCASCH